MSETSIQPEEPNVFEMFAKRISDAADRVSDGVVSIKSSIDVLDGDRPTAVESMIKDTDPASLIARINEAIISLHHQLDSLSEQQERLSELVR